MRASIGWLVWAMWLPCSAFAQTEQEREADMFGGPEVSVEEGETPFESLPVEALPGAALKEGGRDEVLEERTSEQEVKTRLEAADDPLAMGGLVFLRGNTSLRDEEGLGEASWAMPMLTDGYLDARPGDSVRFYARGRLSGDLGGTAFSGALDQLWLKFDVGQMAYVTVGRQRVKWGTGRFWNPTDFLNREALDPLSVSVLDERLGVSLLKVHVPLESVGANLYAFGTFEGAQSADSLGGALRSEWVVGTSEVSTSFAVRKDEPWRLGADFNGAVGPIDLKLEGAFQHGVKTPFFRGQLDTSPLGLDEFDLAGVSPDGVAAAVEAQLPGVLAARQPESYLRDDAWIAQVVVGLEYGANYTEDDVVYVGAEYFYNDAGYDGAELYPTLFQNGVFRPFYTGRHYGAVYVAMPSPGSWDDTTISLANFGNFSDRSFLSRLDVSMVFATYLTFNAYVQGHYGANGEFNFGYSQPALLSEAMLSQIPAEFLDQIPPELSQGVSVAGPRVSAGLGLRMAF